MTTGFVLVHGFWHDHHTWDKVTPLLHSAGHPVAVLDLPGAGANAHYPASYLARPLDAAAFATELSPNAGVSQAERTAAVIEVLKAQNDRTGGKSVLVGHSMGGTTVSDVVEQVPDEIAAVVYLTAFMLRPGLLPIERIRHELLAAVLVPGLLLADPEAVGALRLDPRSDDPAYIDKMHAAFAADVDSAAFQADMAHLHPDEPVQVLDYASCVTTERFGRVPRHYIRCSADRLTTPAGQDEMIRTMDTAMGNATVVHEMATSHSPFHAQPDRLVEILLSTV